jgi:integrase
MATIEIQLNARVIENLPPSAAGSRDVYRDPRFPYLQLRVTSTGSKSWLTRKKLAGKMVNTTLGQWPAMSIDTAHAAALSVQSAIAQGANPNAQKVVAKERALSAGATLREVFRDYLVYKGIEVAPLPDGSDPVDAFFAGALSRPKLASQLTGSTDMKASTAAFYALELRLMFPDWLDSPVVSISDTACASRHRDRTQGRGIFQSGSAARANGGIRTLKAVLNYFTKAGRHTDGTRILTENPASGLVRLNKNTRRATIIPVDVLPAWWLSLDTLARQHPYTQAPTARDLFRLLLLTGCRYSELAKLKWSHVDLAGRVCLLEDTKNRTDFRLPLSAPMVDILAARQQQFAGVSPWVFPGEPLSNPVGELRKWIGHSRDLIGTDWCAHDLRRVYLTLADSLGLGGVITKALVNHALPQQQNDVTGGYVVLSSDRLLDAQEKMSAAILSHATPPSNVVPLRAGAV